MKAVLVIFIAFQLDSGAASNKIEFQNMQDCEHNRKAIVSEFNAKTDWPADQRRRIFAYCAGI